MSDKIKVAVLFGGRSGEHEVSIMSARSVINALDPEKYEITPVGITRQGAWVVGADPMKALEHEDLTNMQPAAILADPSKKGLWTNPTSFGNDGSSPNDPSLSPDGAAGEVVPVGTPAGQLASLSQVDVVFPVLHGTYGEDGTVQGLLELAGVPYVGGGVLNSALAMDKIAFKAVCKAHGFPMGKYYWTTRRRWLAEPDVILDEIEAQLPYPIFTKPANLGSSVGICKCHNREELQRGMDEAAHYDRRLLVEEGIRHAREIEVSVLGNEDPRASVPGEVIPSREFYDYLAKYLDTGEDASELLIPAPLDAEMTMQVQRLAVEVYRAIDGTGMARVDFLLDGETNKLYVNEVNTLPGFTSISMYPKLWEASGISYSRLVDMLVDLALDRYEENVRSERIFRPLAES
ncbi:MAG: D-alanine--D-alanine ligase [Anaerolineae bacterium]|nr:D-alanine--D-alanine ligase [Anaerolineae bacterium]